jgi:hypothetical protein
MVNSSQLLSTKCAKFSLIEEGILHIELIENTEIDLKESKLMQRTSLEITEGKKFVALIDARAEVIISKESREWGSTPEAQKNMLAQAIVVNTLANKLIGNFIIQFHKPPAKTRLFSDERSALRWLKEQKDNYGIK